MPSPFLQQRIIPDASTCILIGRLEGPCATHDFSAYRAILWITDETIPFPSGVLKNSVHVLPLGQLSETLETILNKFCVLDARKIPSVFLTHATRKENTDIYEQVLPLLCAHLETLHRARLTRQKDGFLWQSHLLKNLGNLTKQRIPNQWEGALAGIPAVVCGAGPSLNRTAPLIKNLSCAIFAADSALRKLDQLGMDINFTISIDPAKTPEKCLPPTKSPGKVILTSISPPAWNQALPNEDIFYLTSRQITEDWLSTMGVEKTGITASESCGSTALDLAHYMGCSPIYLFGMDLAGDPKDPSQIRVDTADSSIYQKSGFQADTIRPMVQGNYTEKLPTHLLPDIHALNQRLKNWPKELVYNVNDSGVKLDNTTLIHPDKFEPPTATSGTEQLLGSLPPSTCSPEKRLQEISRLFRDSGLILAEKLPALHQTFKQQSTEHLAGALRDLWSQENIANLLGAYSFKLLPHLVHPISEDTVFWEKQLEEINELSRLMLETNL